MNAIAAVQPLKPLRCAVYARVSVEDTSASDFTSIDAQVDSCRAYITSHKAEGWVAVEPCYVDQGYSGSTIDRPALKALLQEMRKGEIDAVLVHRLDRLSRSVADLCDLLPLFTIPGVQLVAVTQSINTSTPAGRLTLNLLTSFAQFERELAGDRTREKLAATRSAGKWQGSATPFGYGVDHNQKIVVIRPEADSVRDIFRRFVAMGSTTEILEYLTRHKFKTKTWTTKDGKRRGGRPFDRNALYKLLNNRMYLGEVFYNGTWHKGQHSPIVDPEDWTKAQTLLAQRARRTGIRNTGKSQFEFPLMDRLFWEDGREYKPKLSSLQNGIRYRYYAPQRTEQEKLQNLPPYILRVEQLHRPLIEHVRASFRAPQKWLASLPDEVRNDPLLEEGNVVGALGRLDAAWGQLIDAAQAEIIHLLIERVTLYPNGMEVRLNTQHLVDMVHEFASIPGKK